MQTINESKTNPPYLCGRLLAILEETQLRAHNWRLNTTLVDRAYGTASTAPASIFGRLIRAAETAHLPKIRKSGHGNDSLKQAFEQLAADLDARGGFPRTLTMQDQAEFAIGFYHQRAQFRAERGNDKQANRKD